MSKRKWHERVREIQQRNPAGLHPLLRGRLPSDPGSRAWDRVEWQTTAKDPFPAADAAQPILTVLRWMRAKGLLSPVGISVLDAATAGSLETLALERRMVASAAHRFLDENYDSWQQTHGANLVLGGGPRSAADAEAELERLWGEHSRSAG